MGKTYCNYCFKEVEPSREFIYQFESLEFVDEDEELLEFIRNMATYEGEPLRFCKKCYESVEENLLNLRKEEAGDQKITRISLWFLVISLIVLVFIQLKIWMS